MKGNEIREAFLKFFEERGHRVFPSASLVPDDPGLLFTIAGMVPFKEYFLSPVKPSVCRAASCQKCLRTNDIERVGKTPRHHTFFEMLGNFSFGDYFKEEAISWAWELVVKVYGIDPKRLWVTIYEEDEEAYRIWKKVGVKEERIIRLGEDTNFWEMGETGPCGPCSEIIYDFGEEFKCGPNCKDPSCDCDRFLELWNLVFTQYDRKPDGSLEPLPKKNIDTGMGLERTAAVLQGVRSNFETDLIFPIIERAQELTGKPYGEKNEWDVALRVIGDHSRALLFLIADGVFPSNEGRGYVFRRILRRASRFGRKLGVEEPFLYKLLPVVESIFGQFYPEVSRKLELASKVVLMEEERFLNTLAKGMDYLETLIESAADKKVSGEKIFQLYDTYGFPPDLAEEILAEEGLSYDKEAFEKAFQQQKERSRKDWERKSQVQFGFSVSDETSFVGYEFTEWETEVVAVPSSDTVVLRETPFYAEAGGQVSDTGFLEWDGKRAKVVDVKRIGTVVIHKIKGEPPPAGAKVLAIVDKEKRIQTARHHTATHLLQAALRKILGDHVEQSGSLVAPDRLRFDFTHYEALSPAAIREVETLVNEKIWQDVPVVTFWTELEKARRMGALSFFGEKYGDIVRVVKIGDFSMELCGGTHVHSTGNIGAFKIVSESSVAAGVRRIEAVAGHRVVELLREKEETLQRSAALLGIQVARFYEGISKILGEFQKIKQEREKFKSLYIEALVAKLTSAAKEISGFKVAFSREDALDSKSLRELADRLKGRLDGFMLAAVSDGKVSLVIGVGDRLKERLSARDFVKQIAPLIKGGGGGRDDFAQAGGKEPAGIGLAWEKFVEAIKR